jgi:hypothetical protein
LECSFARSKCIRSIRRMQGMKYTVALNDAVGENSGGPAQTPL